MITSLLFRLNDRGEFERKWRTALTGIGPQADNCGENDASESTKFLFFTPGFTSGHSHSYTTLQPATSIQKNIHIC